MADPGDSVTLTKQLNLNLNERMYCCGLSLSLTGNVMSQFQENAFNFKMCVTQCRLKPLVT